MQQSNNVQAETSFCRYRAGSIDFGLMEEQPGDAQPTPFSFLNLAAEPLWGPSVRQVPCYGTRTTAASEDWVLRCVQSGRGARWGLLTKSISK